MSPESPGEVLERLWKQYDLGRRKPPDPVLMVYRELRAVISRLEQETPANAMLVRGQLRSLTIEDDGYKPDLDNAQIG